MATSMGESFWKRFKESQRQLAIDRLRQAPRQSDGEQDEDNQDKDYKDKDKDKDRPGIAERPATSGAISSLEELKALEDFLPPSSFDNQVAKRPTRSGPAAGAAPPPVMAAAGARKAAVPALSRRESANGAVYRTADVAAAGPSEDPLQVVGLRHGRLESVDDHFLLPSQQGRVGAVSRQQARDRDRDRGSPAVAAPLGDGLSEYKRCEEGLSLMIAKSSSLSSLLSQRLASLRILKQLWVRSALKIHEILQY